MMKSRLCRFFCLFVVFFSSKMNSDSSKCLYVDVQLVFCWSKIVSGLLVVSSASHAGSVRDKDCFFFLFMSFTSLELERNDDGGGGVLSSQINIDDPAGVFSGVLVTSFRLSQTCLMHLSLSDARISNIFWPSLGRRVSWEFLFETFLHMSAFLSIDGRMRFFPSPSWRNSLNYCRITLVTSTLAHCPSCFAAPISNVDRVVQYSRHWLVPDWRKEEKRLPSQLVAMQRRTPTPLPSSPGPPLPDTTRYFYLLALDFFFFALKTKRECCPCLTWKNKFTDNRNDQTL